MNQSILRGRLTTDPKINVVKDTTTATFTLAVPDRTHKNSDGNYVTDFIRITTFNSKADIALRHLQKGSEIIVSGKLHSYNYTKNDTTIYGTEVIASNIEFVSDCIGKDDFAFVENVPESEMPFK